MVCLALELVGSWVDFAFSVGMEALYELLLINVPWSQEFSGVLILDLSLPPLAFSLILTAASRLLHPYNTDDKTPRLMVKQFSTVRDTQRGSQVTGRREEGGGR